MKATRFRALARREPFVPLLIRTRAGREYRVTHRWAFWLPPRLRVMILIEGDRLEFLHLADIASVEPLGRDQGLGSG